MALAHHDLVWKLPPAAWAAETPQAQLRRLGPSSMSSLAIAASHDVARVRTDQVLVDRAVSDDLLVGIGHAVHQPAVGVLRKHHETARPQEHRGHYG
eukprot:CAMPEP_0177162632 /NCGR_PEP_ID=MMETSP0367-20130122/5986_1 /TAXON_ID=447022 ORGANISM="Scrippsiella hangoei-like, Strain SHHI-4" /NCGR_SAMPLE_ID=MMETSP0367 /ASSEMBLY_ACC=CAM_ASM_000362 /LENGTH=96 /DNA_ID=CAMNT_0018608411 /DNA_START=122 /DNA_END=410 /DNA_ORIENTATION=+